MPYLKKTSSQLVQEARARIVSMTVDDLAETLNDAPVVLVDVRDSKEWNLGHIPRGDLEFCADPTSGFGDPRMDLDKSIVVYCALGLAGVLAAATLEEMGYDRVANLEGGYEAWLASGRPIET